MPCPGHPSSTRTFPLHSYSASARLSLDLEFTEKVGEKPDHTQTNRWRAEQKAADGGGGMCCCNPCWCLCRSCWQVPQPEPSRAPSKTALSELELNALPSTAYEPRTPDGKHGHDREECSICLASLQPGDVVRRLQCTHCFHKQCIDRWLTQRARCPLCNGNPVVGQTLAPPLPGTMLRESGDPDL